MTEIAHHIRADLDQITDALRWCHTEAFAPAGPRSPEPARAPAGRVDRDGEPLEAEPEAADPDHVRAPKLDVGVGDHRARQAWHHAVRALTDADHRLLLAAHASGHTTQPPPSRVPCTPGDADRLVERLRWRLDRAGLDHPGVRAQLGRARRHVDVAWRTLHAALVRGQAAEAGDEQAVGEGMCLVCRIRPVRSQRSHRCHACQRYWDRSGRRQERPRSLDDPAIDEAKAALARRRARGEGWGDESFAATVPTPERLVVRRATGPVSWCLAGLLALAEGPLLEARVAELEGLVDRFGRREERAELRRLRVRLDRLRRHADPAA